MSGSAELRISDSAELFKYYGMKFFDKREHMKQFNNGIVHFSTTGSLNIGDNTEMNYNEYEIPLFNMPVTINDIEIPCKSYTLYYDWQKMVPIFCYYRLDNSNLHSIDNSIRIDIPTRFAIEGKKRFAALFLLSDFLNRLEIACENKHGFKHIDIKYIDFSKKDNNWKKIVSANMYGFLEVHDIKHSYQNESRVILTETFVTQHVELNLGKWRFSPMLFQYINNEWRWIK